MAGLHPDDQRLRDILRPSFAVPRFWNRSIY
jgi:hypothetical protein